LYGRGGAPDIERLADDLSAAAEYLKTELPTVQGKDSVPRFLGKLNAVINPGPA
jgi:hypothetical protein